MLPLTWELIIEFFIYPFFRAMNEHFNRINKKI